MTWWIHTFHQIVNSFISELKTGPGRTPSTRKTKGKTPARVAAAAAEEPKVIDADDDTWEMQQMIDQVGVDHKAKILVDQFKTI